MASLIVATIVGTSASAQQPNKPNIVFMLMDYLGYGELGVYSCGILRGAATPRIDALAAEGTILLNSNVAAQCTASRSALMTGRSAPGADLLGSHVFDDLMADVIAAKHIGRGVIDGVECEHLAFRNLDIDWQIWIEAGGRPIPRKYVIVSKGVGAAPQYTLRIKEWKTDAPIGADAFTFTPPDGAKKVALDALENIDEVPHGVVKGGKK